MRLWLFIIVAGLTCLACGGCFIIILFHFHIYLFVTYSLLEDYTLSDQKIVGGTVQLLSGKWDASSPSQNLKMGGNVPGNPHNFINYYSSNN